MEIREYAGSPDGWDHFVREQVGWTHFHLYGWRSVIRSTFGHECIYLAAREGGHLVGVLPLVWLRSRIFGSYLVSMPFVNYGGPLGEPAAISALASEAVRRVSSVSGALLELRSRRDLGIELPVSHRKVTVLLELPSDSELLWKALPSKVRSQVRRPRKEGIHVETGLEQVEPFFRVFTHHMRDLGTPTQPLALFRNAVDVFSQDVRVACAYYDGVPIAAGFGFVWGNELEITWASALRRYSRYAANMLVYWSLMERAVEEDLTAFNFGRCTPGGGTHRFKKQWGGRDETLCWYHQPLDELASTPSPDDPAYAWATRIWRKLPTAVTNRLGPRLVRFIP